MRKNAILKCKMEYEFDVATYFFQRYSLFEALVSHDICKIRYQKWIRGMSFITLILTLP